jgi:glycosyltransferase involved in cell wall biosynthesis
MKIIINATILDSNPTGLGIYTLNIIKELSMLLKDDEKVIVYTSSPESLVGLDVDIRKVHKLVQPRYGIAAGILRFLWVQFIFPLRLLKEEYDILYNTAHHAPFFQIKNRKQIITIQNDVEVNFNFRKQHLLQYYYFKYIIPVLLKRSSAVITTSAYARDILLRYYKQYIGSCYYVYNSYNSDIFKLSSNPVDADVLDKYGLEKNSYILTVGASYSHKNIDSLLKAFNRIKTKLGSIHLCVAGYRKNYLNSLNNLNSDDNIILIRYVPQEELVSLYRQALCLAFPSFHESFGIPCIEAMACGCPVIVSNAASLPEVCDDAAYFIDPYDTESIAGGLYRLSTDNSLRDKLIAKGIERVKLFNWERSVKEIIKIFREING